MDHLDDTHDRFVSEWYEPDRDDFGDDSYPYDRDLPRRLRHQVLVDGRLVDSWTERVEGTRWERVARQFDAENTCHHELAPIAPRRHPFAEVLDWLEGLVGGPERLDLLDAVALSAPDRPLIEDPSEREQFDTVGGLLDSLAAAFFADEAQTVLRRALLDVWNDSHDLVLHPKSAHTRPAASAGLSVAPTAGSTRSRTSGRRTSNVTCGSRRPSPRPGARSSERCATSVRERPPLPRTTPTCWRSATPRC